MSNYLDRISLSGTVYPLVDSSAIHSMDGYWTSAQTETAINEATSGKADSTNVEALSGTVTAHTADTTIHLTSGDVESLISSDVASLFGYANYDSTTNRINFKHNSTGEVLTFIDASPFLVDGFLDSVEIKTIDGVAYLVFTWNSDSGKQTTTNIPLTDIFDPSNYLTSADTITAINEATSGKADSSTVSGINDVLTAHTADTTIHVTSADKTTWSGKQDALVSGTNIKTINGTSILGSGNLELQSLPTVSGSTLVFS